jgi:hypothetical protein
MPTYDSAVGALELPLAPGAQDTPIDDPVVAGLGDYLRFCIRYDLNQKLANLRGTSADAVPAGNLFGWNPLEPSATFLRSRGAGQPSPLPALYVWGSKGRTVAQTIVYDVEERDIGILWVFDEIVVPEGLEDRYGLRNAVAKAIGRAISLRAHPAYRYNGGPAGVPIALSLGLSGRGIVVTSIQPGMMSPIPQTIGTAQTADQPIVRAYPSVLATLQIWERIEQMRATDADRADFFLQPAVGPAPALPLDGRTLSADDEEPIA